MKKLESCVTVCPAYVRLMAQVGYPKSYIYRQFGCCEETFRKYLKRTGLYDYFLPRRQWKRGFQGCSAVPKYSIAELKQKVAASRTSVDFYERFGIAPATAKLAFGVATWKEAVAVANIYCLHNEKNRCQDERNNNRSTGGTS